jgi:uncharacterized membrane protein HdeD (DUF308 family)
MATKHWPLWLIGFVVCFVGYTVPHGEYDPEQTLAVGLGYGVLVFTVVFALLILIEGVTGIKMGLFKE